MKKYLSLLFLVGCYEQDVFMEVCIPITCADYSDTYQGEACGEIDNGCGDTLECGTCSHPLKGCGLDHPQPDGTLTEGQENICGGSCLVVEDDFCASPTFPDHVVCSKPMVWQDRPFDNCILDERTMDQDHFGHDWCCKPIPR
jgi:hypothetical protein